MLCINALKYQTANRVGYHTVFTYCLAMDHVKQAFKTLLDFFQASSAEKCMLNKGLDSPTPMQSTDDPSYATSSYEIGESHYLRSDEQSSDNCPVSK